MIYSRQTEELIMECDLSLEIEIENCNLCQNTDIT